MESACKKIEFKDKIKTQRNNAIVFIRNKKFKIIYNNDYYMIGTLHKHNNT